MFQTTNQNVFEISFSLFIISPHDETPRTGMIARCQGAIEGSVLRVEVKPSLN